MGVASFLGLHKKSDNEYKLSYSFKEANADASGGSGGGDGHRGSQNDSGGADGGPDGGSGGGDGGSGCFAKGTPVLMGNGSTKAVENISLGDITAGGKVTAVMQFQVKKGEMYDYKGVTVTGCHPVNDHGIWRYVEESPRALPAPDTENPVTYLFNCEEHRVYVNGIEFSDFIEIDDREPLKADYLKDLMRHHQLKEWQRNGISKNTFVENLKSYLG